MNNPITNSENKFYLGDGVYARIDDLGSLILTTEDGYHATNTIYMELSVLNALINYVKRSKRAN